MVDYQPLSQVGWLDLDETASRQVGEVLRALEEPGTLDPIGLGAVRDTFSDLLAPGTSTIQTRLRYFLFVPWICQRIERSAVPASAFAKRLKSDEATLIQCLRHLGPNQGVMGYTAGEGLKRMPSSAYWGGLGSWGIRRLDWSINDYQRNLRGLRRTDVSDGGDETVLLGGNRMWAGLPVEPPEFLEAESEFDLTFDEARYLVDRIRQRHPQSLLAAACASPALAAAADVPWDVPLALLDDQLASLLHHARCVSELTLGPQLLYNLMVAELARDELGADRESQIEAAQKSLRTWSDGVTGESDTFAAWVTEIDEFWATLAPFRRIPEPAVIFVTAMVRAAAEDPNGFVSNQAVRKRICDREIKLKGSRARLGNRSALLDWNGQEFGGQLVYRWPTCQSYLRDLAVALGDAA